jgi:hypothetical protein
MTEPTAEGFAREGAPAFPVAETTGETTPADSHSEDENQGGDTPAAPGENKEPEDNTPFHQHPRWLEREREWTERFNSQESRHQADIAGIRQEFGTARKDNAEATQIPAWFGGDQAQWDAYRADRDAELKVAEEAAYQRLKSDQTSSQDEVRKATEWLQTEVGAIESDKELNPSGAAIDREKLFKVAFDNQLVDTQGRWNYRAAYRLMVATAPPAPKPNASKKQDAAATTSESKGETPPAAFKTSADFKKKRPW